MSGKKVIVVIGATGQQGGSVAQSLLTDPQFAVRALTRNKTSDKAKELQSKGAEIVECNVNNSESLVKAFAGAYGVFGVTNAYDPETHQLGHEGEFIQGKNMVDAAVAAKVTHFIFSSLDDVNKISGGKYNVPHFTNKNKVEEYAKTKNFKYSSYMYTGYFLNNYFGWCRVTKVVKDGKESYVYPARCQPDVKLPMTEVDVDLGPCVLTAFAHPEKYGKGTRINVAREYLTEKEFFNRVHKLTGIPVSVEYNEPPPSQQDEFTHMFHYFHDYGYYQKDKADLTLTREVNPKLKTIEDFIKDRKYSPAVYHV